MVFNRKRRVRKRRKPRRKKGLGISMRGAKTRRYETKNEKIVALVAKRVADDRINANRLRLCMRRYLFPASFTQGGVMFVHDPIHYEFGPGQTVDWSGLRVRVDRIMKADTKGYVSLPPPQDDPLTQESEQSLQILQGANVVSSHHTHGYRRGNEVKINGAWMSVRCRLPAQDTQADNNQPMPFIDRCEVKYALILQTFSTESQNTKQPPDIQTALPWRHWGYQAEIDKDASMNLTLGGRIRTLMKGSIFLSPQRYNTNVKQRNHYVKFKRPILLEYEELDQLGTETLKHQIWFVCRSNVPSVATADYADYTPYIQAATKLYYYDV